MSASDSNNNQLKQTLRVRMQALLADLNPKDAAQFTERIFQKVIHLPEYERARSILSFVSMSREAGTHNLIRHSLRLGKKVCVPAFDRERREYFVVAVKDFDRDLGVGHFNILEPRDARPADKQTDLAIVPGLAFDKQGNRLGRGRGYFDSLLRGHRGTKAALAFDFQVVDSVPINGDDVPVDIVITEDRLIRAER